MGQAPTHSCVNSDLPSQLKAIKSGVIPRDFARYIFVNHKVYRNITLDCILIIERRSRMLRFSHLRTLIIGLVRVKCNIVQYPAIDVFTAANMETKLF